MPRKSKQPKIHCEHFAWRLIVRNGVYYADGRGRGMNLGKHSLESRDKQQALQNLKELDLHMAIKLGKTKARLKAREIAIADGWQRYMDYCGRGPVLGGASAATIKRYRPVRDKHEDFCTRHGISDWIDFDKGALERYGNQLSRTHADGTLYLELNLLKSVVRWLIDERLLPSESLIKYSFRRPQGTDTYCYRPDEVQAMIDQCRLLPKLGWLGDVIFGLAFTGLRISELAALRWTDIQLDNNTLVVADERSSSRKRRAGTARTTKGRRSRRLPIHPELRRLLVTLPRSGDGYVFRAALGGRLRPRIVLKMFIEQVIEPLKDRFSTPVGDIGFEHGRLRSFRHYFCSQCFLAGGSEGEIREWLGHADSKMVELYRHLRSDDAQRKMAKIEFLPGQDVAPGEAG